MEPNYLPEQYKKDKMIEINHNYLQKQFADYDIIFEKLKELVIKGDFTLGESVNEFEKNFAKIVGTKYAIGVGSGTDALFLSLKALGIGEGDEVITSPYGFYSTVGAIVTAGAKPVFVDVGEDYNINPNLIEGAITDKTKAIIPVHWAGLLCDMEKIIPIAEKNNIHIVEDACQAFKAYKDKRYSGNFGTLGCFSFHPLKIINIWGDGGMIVTNSQAMHDKLLLLRNHGLINRDECVLWGYNSRLDSLQAVVGDHLLKKVDSITKTRIRNADYFNQKLVEIPEVLTPIRYGDEDHVYHLYIIRAKDRDRLQEFLIKNGIDAKVHYSPPLHMQIAANKFGYKKGDFPVAEKISSSVLSLPVHEFITQEQQDYIVEKIKKFYNG